MHTDFQERAKNGEHRAARRITFVSRKRQFVTEICTPISIQVPKPEEPERLCPQVEDPAGSRTREGSDLQKG